MDEKIKGMEDFKMSVDFAKTLNHTLQDKMLEANEERAAALFTKQKIDEITGKINLLSENFKKPDYPFETEEELNKRIQSVKEQGGWGITTVQSGTGSIENTLEVPLVPATNRGLKFHTAAEELKIIDEEFFKLRNHNPQFKKSLKEIKEEIKA